LEGEPVPPALLIPAADPRESFLAHQHEIQDAIERVLMGGDYILGQEVAAFEREFARYLGTPGVAGVASGTEALALALKACGVQPGDGVVTVSHTAVATVAAIELVGALPVLVDIDTVTLTIDAKHLDATIIELRRAQPDVGRRLRAAVPVHLYGNPADLPAVTDVCRRHGLKVVEDCAQAHGAEAGGVRVGAIGDAGAFSFYPTKNLGALGDGGAVTAVDPAVVERVARLRQYGWVERNVSAEPGWNSRLDELQAAILRVKLRYLDEENERRRRLAAIYTEMLQGCGVTLPEEREGFRHVYHQFVVRCPDRDGLRAFLAERRIGTLVHYPEPVHLQPAYRGRVRLGPGGLPNSERACREVVSLPIQPHLSDEQARRVATAVLEWARTRR
jgi:dTDP-4-amino-4,6-dideoxygalactose transaminase